MFLLRYFQAYVFFPQPYLFFESIKGILDFFFPFKNIFHFCYSVLITSISFDSFLEYPSLCLLWPCILACCLLFIRAPLLLIIGVYIPYLLIPKFVSYWKLALSLLICSLQAFFPYLLACFAIFLKAGDDVLGNRK